MTNPSTAGQRCQRTEFDVWVNDGPTVWRQDAPPTVCSHCQLPPECHDY